MKKLIAATLASAMLVGSSLADVPDISDLTQEELLQLQASVNITLKEKAVYTLLPGIYDCKRDFTFNWYNCKVLPGPDGEERKATITFHEYAPDEDAFLSYEVSSKDEGIKLSLLQTDSSAGLFMVITGAPLEAIPFGGM